MQSAQALLVTALARTTAATAIRHIPHRPHRLTGLATAMGRITAVAIHPTVMLATAILRLVMLATAILLLAMLATAILLMAMAAPTSRAIASPAGWRFIEPAGAEARAQKAVPPRRCGSPATEPAARFQRPNGRRKMIRSIALACFALAFATSAQAMTPAPIPQQDGMIQQVAVGCGAGRTRVNGVCVARTTIRQTRRAVRRY